MNRLTSIAASILFGATITSAATAGAETQAEIANRLNEEGKTAMYANNYAEASTKFQQAIARVPEPKYFINLAMSMFQEGRFDESLVACSAVEVNESASPAQKDKAKELMGRIRAEAKAQGITLKPTGGGGGPTEQVDVCVLNPQDARCQQQGTTEPPPQDPDCAQNPNQPKCQTTQQPPVQRVSYQRYRPPTGPGVYEAVLPNNFYTWTLGAELFGGGGTIGQDGVYGTAAVGLRIKGDYMLDRASRLGAQGYIQITHVNEDPNNPLSGVNSLDIFDVGIAAYKELCPRGAPNLCLRPLAGAQLALMSPNGQMDDTGAQIFNYAAFGARLELGLQYAFGTRQEHVIGAAIGVNAYSAVFADPQDGSPSRMEVGLDKGGAFGYASIGYTYRFNTPLGRSAIVLE